MLPIDRSTSYGISVGEIGKYLYGNLLFLINDSYRVKPVIGILSLLGILMLTACLVYRDYEFASNVPDSPFRKEVRDNGQDTVKDYVLLFALPVLSDQLETKVLKISLHYSQSFFLFRQMMSRYKILNTRRNRDNEDIEDDEYDEVLYNTYYDKDLNLTHDYLFLGNEGNRSEEREEREETFRGIDWEFFHDEFNTIGLFDLSCWSTDSMNIAGMRYINRKSEEYYVLKAVKHLRWMVRTFRSMRRFMDITDTHDVDEMTLLLTTVICYLKNPSMQSLVWSLTRRSVRRYPESNPLKYNPLSHPCSKFMLMYTNWYFPGYYDPNMSLLMEFEVQRYGDNYLLFREGKMDLDEDSRVLIPLSWKPEINVESTYWVDLDKIPHIPQPSIENWRILIDPDHLYDPE